jgi:hypothetical protein
MQITQMPQPAPLTQARRPQTQTPFAPPSESADTTRLRARTQSLSNALHRLEGAFPAKGISAVISGQFTASGGVSLLVAGQKISALITDDRGGTPPWVYYNDAKQVDQITVDAEAVDNLYTAGGNDVLTVRASGSVTSVNTGNDSDIVSISADVVAGVTLDVTEDPRTMASGVIRHGDDVAQITGRLVSAVYGGGGNDRIIVAATERGEASGGEGNDVIAVAAPTGGADGGNGDDHLILSIGHGETEGDLFTTTGFVAGSAPTYAAFRTDVYGGAGNDVIDAAIGTQLGIEGGTGDDRITIASGRGALVWAAGDGTDTVHLRAGAEVVLRLEGITGYTVERDDNGLTLRLGNGSIRFDGLDQSGFIAVSLGWGQTEVLHPGRPTADMRV